MKYIYVLLLILFVSCAKNKQPKKVSAVKAKDVVEVPEEENVVLNSVDTEAFLVEIKKTKTKEFPIFETTNFDSFITAEDYNEVNVKALQLERLYPNFYNKDYNFKTLASYRIQLDKAFYTLVVALQKTDNEMESRLINYDLKGNIIDSKVVAYDEIAEGMSQIKSIITENEIRVHHVFWSEKKEVEEQVYEIPTNGKFKEPFKHNLHQKIKDYTIINNVLNDLKLNWVQIKKDLIVVQENPGNSNEIIVVIPEIIDEGEYYFELNSHIVLVNAISGKITHKYFESYKTNGWQSDAVMLDRIEININKYLIGAKNNAFGLNVHYHSLSSANPYSKKSLNLYVKEGSLLKNILHNYTIEEYTGEWDGACYGEFLKENKNLIISNTATNNFSDFLVITSYVKTKNIENENGECDNIETRSTQISKLKFNGQVYKENISYNKIKANNLISTDNKKKLFEKFVPQKLDSFKIEKLHADYAYQLDTLKIVTGTYEPVEGKKAESDTEKDWGNRLLLLNNKNEIVYKSQGVGDVYLYEPHFYKSNKSNKVIIICQLGYEYPFGGDVFIFENGKITAIGTLDIEGYTQNSAEEFYLTNIVQIHENDNQLTFSFKSDKLVFNPGGQSVIVNNNDVKFIYDNTLLQLEE